MNDREIDFAYKVRHALNERLDQLPEKVVERLASAREMAISRKKEEAPLRVFARQNVFAGYIGNFFTNPATYWLSRFSAAIVMAVLITGVMGVYHAEEQRQLQETARMDAAVLSDELPPDAYLDPGFKNYLHRKGF
ncbi:MAG: DUF3619 family protein [Oxalobacter sp.]|nr:MAG: DUF3619 family protein [Oxalobacter sp.]